MTALRRRILVLAIAVLAVLGGAAATPARASLVGSPSVVATGLQTPWDIVLAPAPDPRIFVTERDAKDVRVVSGDGPGSAVVFADTNPGHGTVLKFLGMALHPNFPQDDRVYLYVTYTTGSRVLLLHDDPPAHRLVFDRFLFDDGPIATDGNHDGGRIRFGPDGKLYITTGDVHDPSLPQDPQKLNGKILRVNDDGTPPADNPFLGMGGNARYVWSLGHRHPQGIAWDADGRLWETEHGPSGGGQHPAEDVCCRDELNLIVKGGNFGWPVISGTQTHPGMRAPAATSGDSTTWAPGGLAFASDGRLYAPLLRGAELLSFSTDCAGVTARQEALRGDRLRAGTFGRGALFYASDGSGAGGGQTTAGEVRRIAVAPDGFAPLGCPSDLVGPAPAPGASSIPTSPPAAALASPARPGAPAVAPSSRARTPLARLVRRTRAALLARGRAGLRRHPVLVVRAGGFGPGVLVLRLARDTVAPGATALATVRVVVRDRSAMSLRLRLGLAGRRALARSGRLRVRIPATFTPAGGVRSRLATTLTLR